LAKEKVERRAEKMMAERTLKEMHEKAKAQLEAAQTEREFAVQDLTRIRGEQIRRRKPLANVNESTTLASSQMIPAGIDS